jgi:hypothetical protein
MKQINTKGWDKFDYELPQYSYRDIEWILDELIDEVLEALLSAERSIDIDTGIDRSDQEIEASGVLPAIYHKLKAMRDVK